MCHVGKDTKLVYMLQTSMKQLKATSSSRKQGRANCPANTCVVRVPTHALTRAHPPLPTENIEMHVYKVHNNVSRRRRNAHTEPLQQQVPFRRA